MYKTKFERDFNKLIFKQDGKFRKRVYDKIEKLKTDPYRRESKKLKGSVKGLDFRRVKIGDYRLIYLVDDKEKVVKIYDLEHRKKSYKKFGLLLKKLRKVKDLKIYKILF